MYKKMNQSLRLILGVLLFASFFTVACNNEAEKKEEAIDPTGEQKPIPTPNKTTGDTTTIDTTGEQKPIPTPNK